MALQDNASDKPNTSDLILDAAERVVARDGSRKLTIDAVVRESGFSKGGVLYNFPSKLALIEGMVERMVGAFSDRHDQALQQASRSNIAQVEPLIEAFFDAREKDEDKKKLSMGLLAALAENPELIEPVRQTIARIREDIMTHAHDKELALIVMLAADGLHFSDILGLDILSDDQREAVEARLMKLVSEPPQ
jgi:AcrR family transcriptional regulator